MYPRESQTVTAGGTVDIQCRAIAGMPTPSIHWVRENDRILGVNVEQLSSGLLRITNVTLDDEGGYICVGTNTVGTSSMISRIEVNSYPVVTITPPEEVLQVRLGERLRLICKATGRPQPSVAWGKDSRDFSAL